MIPESELIITEKKRIYHLDLAPDEIADKIILVGDPSRANKVAQKFNKITLKRTHREFYTITGELNNKKISVVGTGIGVSNIEIVINEIDALFNIDLEKRELKKDRTILTFLRLGTSGTIQKNIPPGTLVFTKEAIGFDAVSKFYDYRLPQKDWHNKFKQFVEKNYDDFPEYYIAESKGNWKIPDTVIPGITITAPGFYAAQGRNIRRYKLKYKDFPHKLSQFSYGNMRILNVEMEASLINFLGNMLGHNTATLCVVLANRETKDFIKDYDKAIETLIDVGLNTLLNSN